MEDYAKDPRAACKYGANCYQKNPNHKTKFKHPPREDSSEKSPKRFKKDEKPEEKPHEKPSENESSSQSMDTSNAAADTEPVSSDCPAEVNEPDVQDKRGDESGNKSDTEDEEELPLSPSDIKLSIKQKFLVEMPEDFYSFWEFCRSLSKEKPEDTLKNIKLALVGPYDVLSGKISRSSKPRTLSRFLRHWRFYYDPPEFQTVLVQNGEKLYHIGYFRDDPQEMPCFLASNSASKDGLITPMGPNIFSSINMYIEDFMKSADPFAKIKVSKLQKSLQTWAEQHGHSLDKTSSKMKERTRKTVCKTFHGAGLVVPYNRKTDVGYRPLIESNVNLRRILNKVQSAKNDQEKEDALDELHVIINAANIANDECDFGTSIELGLDLFTFGEEALNQSALHLLVTGYSLVNRKQFADIVKAHLNHRKKGIKVDMFL